MNPYSLLYIEPNFVPPDVIKTLLKNKSENYTNAVVGTAELGFVRSSYRMAKMLTLPEVIKQELDETFVQIHEQYLKQVYNSTLKHVEPFQFLRYDIDDHYGEHNDSEDVVDGKIQRLVERDISVIMYLNDDYDGGFLEFPNLQLLIKPKASMLIAFPSYMEFTHKVHPVTKGTRYSLVTWMATNKRLYERPYESKSNRDVSKEWFFSN